MCEQRTECVGQAATLPAIVQPRLWQLRRPAEQHEYQIQVIRLGQLDRRVEILVDGLVDFGWSTGAVALDLPRIALEDPPANRRGAARLGGRERVAQGRLTVGRADP